MATTQSVLDSTKTLLDRVKTEGITANGQVINPINYGTPITADGLTNSQQPADIQPFQDKTDYSIGGFDLGDFGGETSDMDKLFQSYMGTQTAPTNPADTYNTLYDQSGVADKETALLDAQKVTKAGQAKLAGINAQLQGLELATQQRKLQIGQEAISAGAMQGRNIEEERNLAIRSLPLQAQAYVAQAEIASAQGDEQIAQNALIQAQNKLENAFKIQTDYNNAVYEYKQNLVDKVYEFASKKQQAQLDAKKLQEERVYNEKRDMIKNAQSVANSLLQTQPDLASQITQIDWSKPTAQADYSKLLKQVKTESKKLNYQELPDGRAVMLDEQGNIVKTISGGGDDVPEIPEGTPSEIKNSANITNIIANSDIGQGTKTNLANILGVINASEDLAKANQLKGFKGVSPLNTLLDIKIPFTDIGIPFRRELQSKEGSKSEGYINAINLKVQQWASGAALTKQQTEQVEKFTPKMTDTDTKVRTKINNLTNFMYTQAKSTLQSEGINFTPDNVNLFETYDLWKKATPEQKKEIENLINQ